MVGQNSKKHQHNDWLNHKHIIKCDEKKICGQVGEGKMFSEPALLVDARRRRRRHKRLQLCKVGVPQRLPRGDARRRVVDEHARQQVQAQRVERRRDLLERPRPPLGEGLLPVGELPHARPAVLVRRAHDLEDLEELVDLRVAREQRAVVDHLDEDAADGPDVDGRRVRLGAEQDLGRAVPERDDLVRVRAHGDAKRAREPKVGELELVARALDEQVLGLEVAVQDAVACGVGVWMEYLLVVCE